MNDALRPSQGALVLGQSVAGSEHYDPALLCALPRRPAREALGFSGALPFDGCDVWTAYELSWLDPRGKPVAACGEFVFPCTSPAMIESKSLKLYLNSLNQEHFASTGDAVARIRQDLSAAAGAPVEVRVQPLAAHGQTSGMGSLPGTCLDDLPVDISGYRVDPALLTCETDAPSVEESLCSHLFRSVCPVTAQPDWASVSIRYAGPRICHGSLLRYLCSFRLQPEFHEHCVERIFRDVLAQCRCEQLTVEARFLRRGGLDINPFRSNSGATPSHIRLWRQ